MVVPIADGPMSAGSTVPRIAVLGPLSISGGKRLASRADRVVLGTLAAQLGVPVTTSDLAELAFGSDEPPAGSRRAVQIAVWRLRQRLGAAAIQTIADSYRLDPASCRVDTVEFEELITQGRDQLTHGQGELAASTFDAALALWRGDPLPDLGDRGRSLPELRRLAELRLGAMEDHAEAMIGAQRADDAVALLDRLVAAEPLREHAWRLLADAWTALERPNEVTRTLDRARMALADAGLQPGIELRAAEGGSASPAQHLFSPLLAAVLDGEQPLAGRAEELRVLTGWLAAERGPRLVVLSGAAGVGKTRLVAEATSRCTADHVVAGCGDAYLTTPFLPFADIARHLLHTRPPRERTSLAGGPLSALLPGSASPFAHTDHAQADQYQLFAAVTDLVAAAAADGGVVLVLDDAHLLPATSLHLLRHVLSHLTDAPVRAVLLVRDGAVHPPGAAEAFAELRRVVPHHQLALEGLDRAATAGMLARLLGESVDPSLVVQVHDITTGNPLFIRQLASDRAALFDLDAAAAAIWKHDGLVAAVAARLTPLSPAGSWVVEAASVNGSQFDRRVLAAVAAADARLDPADLDRGLLELRTAGIVQHIGGDRFGFAHDLFRTASRTALSSRRRSQLHLLTGRALLPFVGRGAAVDEVAHHLAAAWPLCPAAEVVVHLRAAGEQAAAQLDFDRAAVHFLHALDLLCQEQEAADDDVRLELLLSAGRALADCGQFDEARREYRTAAELARGMARTQEFASAVIGYAETFAATGLDDATAVGLLDEAVALTEQIDHATAAELTALLYIVEPARAQSHAERFGSRVETAADADRAFAMLDELWWRRLAAEQVETAQRMIDLGERVRDDRIVALATLRHWCALVHAGRGSFADPRAEWIAGVADEADDPLLTWRWKTWSVVVDVASGRSDQAERTLERLRSVWLPAEVARGRLAMRPGRLASVLNTQLAWLSFFAGRDADPQRVLAGFHREAVVRGMDPRYLNVMMLALFGEREPTIAMAEELIRDATPDAPRTVDWLTCELQLAIACDEVGYRPGLDRAWDLLLPYAHLHAFRGVVLYYGPVSHYLGRIAAARGDRDQAIELLEAGLEASTSAGAELRRQAAVRWLDRVRRHDA